MKISIHTLCWNNVNSKLIETHKKVMNHLGLVVNYTEGNYDHGSWMNYILNNIKSDIYFFVDIDCLIFDKSVIEESVSYITNEYLVGNAQVTNCIKAKHDLFCAPAFLGISKKYYESIGKPSAVNNRRSDVAQEFTRTSVEKEKRLKMYFPTSFQSVPKGGIWRLSSYGYYGIGTIFDEKIYHLFQSRFDENFYLFEQTANCIIKNEIKNIDRKYPSKNEYLNILQIEDDYGGL